MTGRRAVLAVAAALAAAGAARGAEVPAAVLEPGYLREVATHLYRWYLDEEDFDLERGAEGEEIVFWARGLEVERDEGDASEWAEIRMPQLGLGVRVKRPDYSIEEVGLEVKSSHFRIVDTRRLEGWAGPGEGEEGWVRAAQGMKDLLEDVRDSMDEEIIFPDKALTERLHKACREAMRLNPESREAGDQVIHIAPMSPVANEVWVFVENENLLMRFSSDDDIEEPALWEWQRLDVDEFHVLRQTLVALDEEPGSNVFLTRDQVGRALFNCVALGKRLIVINPEDPDAPAIIREHLPGVSMVRERNGGGRAAPPGVRF